MSGTARGRCDSLAIHSAGYSRASLTQSSKRSLYYLGVQCDVHEGSNAYEGIVRIFLVSHACCRKSRIRVSNGLTRRFGRRKSGQFRYVRIPLSLRLEMISHLWRLEIRRVVYRVRALDRDGTRIYTSTASASRRFASIGECLWYVYVSGLKPQRGVCLAV